MALLPSAAVSGTTMRTGTIDYRLERSRVLDEIRSGDVSINAVCDAHPELLRVAKNVAAPTDESCPICETGELRLVGYVFGPRLGSGGKCVVNEAELGQITQQRGEFNVYEVEVCADCGWNYRLRSYRIETPAKAI